MKNTAIETKNSLEGSNSRHELAEKRIKELRLGQLRLSVWRIKKEWGKMKKSQNAVGYPQAYQQHILRVPEGEDREKGAQTTFEEIMTKNTQIWWKSNLHVQTAQQIPNRINSKRSIPRKTKKISKVVKEKQFITYTWSLISLLADFPSETTEARKQWDNMLNVLKGKDCRPRILYLKKWSFENKGKQSENEIKTIIPFLIVTRHIILRKKVSKGIHTCTLKTIKHYLKKLKRIYIKDILCSCIRRLNFIKMAVFPIWI